MKFTKFFALMCAAATLSVACDSNPATNTPEPTGDLVLSADVAAGVIGQPITFTAMQGDVDVTDVVEIYETENYTQVTNPFTPEIDGDFTFYAVNKSAVSNRLTIHVTAEMPETPADTNPESTDFKHRLLIVEHTATGCGYCPQMKTVLKELHEDATWGDRFLVAEAHYSGLAGNDPAKSTDAQVVGSFYTNVSGFPAVTYNLYGGLVMDRTTTAHINKMETLWKESADAGIAVAANETSSSVLVKVDVKSAKEQSYRVAAWLLEDNIYGRQSGASQDWHHYHNNAIRKIDGQRNSSDISGDDLGTLAVGETGSITFELPIVSQKWVRENLKVLVFVTAPQGAGKYDLVNAVVCPINSAIGYDYN